MFTRRFVLVAGTLLFLSVTAVGDQNIPTAICNDNRTTAGTLAHSVLQIHLEARQAVWYPNGSDAAHLLVSAFGEEGHGPQIPGPLIAEMRTRCGVSFTAPVLRQAISVSLRQGSRSAKRKWLQPARAISATRTMKPAGVPIPKCATACGTPVRTSESKRTLANLFLPVAALDPKLASGDCGNLCEHRVRGTCDH